MTRAKYEEGDWFAVPLRTDGFGIGIVARKGADGVLFGYFFGPKREATPDFTTITFPQRGDAVLFGKFGHLGLVKCRWPILGRASIWNRELWPMPAFWRVEEVTGRNLRVYCDDASPSRLIRQESVDPSTSRDGLPRDSLMGAGFVEISLTQLLE